MKKLILIRHAKSSWETNQRDKDRPLNDRGYRDAEEVATLAVDFLPKQYIVMASTAKRATETANIFTRHFKFPLSDIHFIDQLYTFSCGELEKIVRGIENRYDNVILFGHNEAITDFVNKFGDRHIENVPTSGFVSMAFDEKQWEDIRRGKTVKTIFPKDLRP